MRVLVITSLFPTPEIPTKGIFVYHALWALGKIRDLRFTVVVPVPLLPFQRRVINDEMRKRFKSKMLDEMPNIDDLYYLDYYFLPRAFHPLCSIGLYHKIVALMNDVLRNKSFDLIHAHFLFPEGIISSELGCRFSLKTICTVHGSDLNIMAGRFYWRSLLYRALRHISGLIFVSRALYEKFACEVSNHMDITQVKLSVIPNGFADWGVPKSVGNDERLLDQLRKRNKRIILFVGNLIKVKRPDIMIRAFAYAKKNNLNATLVVIGKGPKVKEIRKMADQLGLVEGEDFILMGQRPHEGVLWWMREADLLVLTSENEGFPTVVLESLNLGTPVVATAVGGIPEVVVDGVNGFLSVKNDSMSVAEQIIKALNWPWNVDQVRASVKNYAWTHIVDQLYAYYHEVAKGG